MLLSKYKKTIIIVSHKFSLSFKHGDYITILKEGSAKKTYDIKKTTSEIVYKDLFLSELINTYSGDDFFNALFSSQALDKILTPSEYYSKLDSYEKRKKI